MNFDDKLKELFIDLPEPPLEVSNAVRAVSVSKLLQVGGILPSAEGRLQYAGRVGVEVKLDQARLAARMAAILALAIAKRELGGTLNKIKRVIRIDGYVACGADFRDHIKVVDGASELFVQIFGTQGKHLRTAVGAVSLPQNACVEISVIFETK